MENAGTAWARRSSGTSPTTAMVAACRKSATSEPVIVATSTTRRSSLDHEAGRAYGVAAVEVATGVGGGGGLDGVHLESGRLRGLQGVSDRRHLRFGEENPG